MQKVILVFKEGYFSLSARRMSVELLIIGWGEKKPTVFHYKQVKSSWFFNRKYGNP